MDNFFSNLFDWISKLFLRDKIFDKDTNILAKIGGWLDNLFNLGN